MRLVRALLSAADDQEVRDILIDKPSRLRSAIMLFFVLAFGAICLGWFCNIIGIKEANAVLFFLGAFLIGAKTLLNPALLGASGGIGLLLGWLNSEGAAKGAGKGIYFLYQASVWTLLWFTLTTMVLATWSFQESPGSFWVFAMGTMVMALAVTAYKVEGKTTFTLIAIYAIVVMASAGWQTLSTDQKPNWSWEKIVRTLDVDKTDEEKAVEAKENLVSEAKAKAEADEVTRLTKAVTQQLPTTIAVPHCKNGVSAPVILPVGWHLRSGWGGGSVKVEYLSGGDWEVATRSNTEKPVEAFRYCTNSEHNAALGIMPLSWTRI